MGPGPAVPGGGRPGFQGEIVNPVHAPEDAAQAWLEVEQELITPSGPLVLTLQAYPVLLYP